MLVFFPDASLLDRFLKMLGHLPDIEVVARGEVAGDGPGMAVDPDLFPVVARWQLAPNIALRFVNVPVDELGSRVGEIAERANNSSRPVVLVCHTDKRSQRAAAPRKSSPYRRCLHASKIHRALDPAADRIGQLPQF